MEDSLSDSIAKLLNLNKDGRAVPARTETVEEARARTVLITSHLSYSKDRLVSAEEFASLYLPSLIRSFLALGTTFKRTPLSRATHASYVYAVSLLTVNSLSSLPRFVREFPNEASAFFLKFVDTAIDMIDDHLDAMKNKDIPGAAAVVTNLVDTLCHLSTILSEHIPTTSPLPSLPPTSRRSLRSLATRLLKGELPEIEAAITTHTGVPLDIICEVLLRLAEDRMPRGSNGAPFVGESCELRVAAGTTLEDSTCVRMREGREMMACSRCLAVRYCSTEHQKADWKRHKRFCFKPSW